jgi:hypothetical protein
MKTAYSAENERSAHTHRQLLPQNQYYKHAPKTFGAFVRFVPIDQN